MFYKRLYIIKLFFGVVSFLLLTYVHLFYPISFIIKEYQIKHQAKQKLFSSLPEEELLVIAENEKIVWEEEGKEFFLNGHMYDVVKKKILQGGIYFFVINDDLEDQLLSMNNRFFDCTQFEKQKKQNSTHFIQQKKWVYELVTQYDSSASIDGPICSYYYKKGLYRLVKLDIILPPPKLA